MDHAKGFTEVGHASWYGKKFHGHKTSNGEIYDMYAMSAAHKNLPIPTYVKVTRIDNGKQVIVRVNDRGPFHQGRVIDLSYAAAHKLDMLKSGTSKVKLEAIVVPPPWEQEPLFEAITPVSTSLKVEAQTAETLPIAASPAMSPTNTEPDLYVQVTATQDSTKAARLVDQLALLFETDARTINEQQIHKVQLGPFKTEDDANKLIEILKQGEFSSAFKVYAQ
ncbi:septal ring lytic transglycosylase RlpA family protein [Echinimonas agarilytica]|uniref:Endolytic peptidoglycan transglycosylase RlpA n=2 Tax=Echinimonas agarilytica TaxID=1215918 RepID=A0AA41W574_9GAMM|nr:septal ring lytic transglycosylase RlpA family protein [Echinimonas agarilytica]